MKRTILTIVLAVLAFGSLSAQAAQTGSVVGWGRQVVGVDTSSGFTAIAAGGDHSLGLKACLYEPIGDINDDCKVDLADLALICDQWLATYTFSDVVDMAANWLIDCDTDPSNPACVPVQ